MIVGSVRGVRLATRLLLTRSPPSCVIRTKLGDDGSLAWSDAVSVSVQKARGVTVRGYRDAVSRLRAAHDAWDHDGVYIAVTEATNWLHSLNVSGNEDIDAVIFARNRSHHHGGSITYPDEGERVYRWRPASQLPVPPDRRHQDAKREKKYVARLAGKPLLDVFGRLDTVRF